MPDPTTGFLLSKFGIQCDLRRQAGGRKKAVRVDFSRRDHHALVREPRDAPTVAPCLVPGGALAGSPHAAVTARRLGLLLPSSGTIQEVDFYRRVPPHVSVHAERMRLPTTTEADEARMLDEHVMPAAMDLATIHPDVVVFSCTSAAALRGREYESQ